MQINFMLLSHSHQMTFWRGLGEKFIARQMMMYLRFKMTIATVGGWVAFSVVVTNKIQKCVATWSPRLFPNLLFFPQDGVIISAVCGFGKRVSAASLVIINRQASAKIIHAPRALYGSDKWCSACSVGACNSARRINANC
jgi:hypothetical protein